MRSLYGANSGPRSVVLSVSVLLIVRCDVEVDGIDGPSVLVCADDVLPELRDDVIAHLGFHLLVGGRVRELRRGVVRVIDGDIGIDMLVLLDERHLLFQVMLPAVEGVVSFLESLFLLLDVRELFGIVPYGLSCLDGESEICGGCDYADDGRDD